jgi:hypothetical protein
LLLLLNDACLAEKQHTPMLLSLVWHDRGSNLRSTALEASTLTITTPMRLPWNGHMDKSLDRHEEKARCWIGLWNFAFHRATDDHFQLACFTGKVCSILQIRETNIRPKLSIEDTWERGKHPAQSGMLCIHLEFPTKKKKWIFRQSTGYLNFMCHYKQWYIAGSAKCSTKSLSKLLTSILISGQNRAFIVVVTL